MCSIMGSFDRERLIELCRLNEYRGQYAHSISYYEPVNGQIDVTRKTGEINYDDIKIPQGHYCIVHMQAPTGDYLGSIHPAYVNGNLLWHNGIIKQSYIAKMQSEIDPHSDFIINWDTYLLLLKIKDNFKGLHDIDGSFSCLMYKEKELFLFRNIISPMFYNANLDISSTRFERSYSTDHDVVFQMDFLNKTLVGVDHFATKNNPYYI